MKSRDTGEGSISSTDGLYLLSIKVNTASISKNKKVLEGEDGDGRDPTPNNMSELVPAAKFRCWRQKIKVNKGGILKNTDAPQDEEHWRCICGTPGAR
jgi:hypothetical protein